MTSDPMYASLKKGTRQCILSDVPISAKLISRKHVSPFWAHQHKWVPDLAQNRAFWRENHAFWREIGHFSAWRILNFSEFYYHESIYHVHK